MSSMDIVRAKLPMLARLRGTTAWSGLVEAGISKRNSTRIMTGKLKKLRQNNIRKICIYFQIPPHVLFAPGKLCPPWPAFIGYPRVFRLRLEELLIYLKDQTGRGQSPILDYIGSHRFRKIHTRTGTDLDSSMLDTIYFRLGIPSHIFLNPGEQLLVDAQIIDEIKHYRSRNRAA